jgi:hypothetical protein
LPARIGRDQPGHAEHRIGRKTRGIEIIVVDAAIDHVDLHPAGDRAHPDDIVVDHEIGGLDQLDAHRIREEAVLVIGRVEMARGQHDAHRLLPAAGATDCIVSSSMSG